MAKVPRMLSKAIIGSMVPAFCNDARSLVPHGKALALPSTIFCTQRHATVSKLMDPKAKPGQALE
jgi:hypothetical protein